MNDVLSFLAIILTLTQQLFNKMVNESFDSFKPHFVLVIVSDSKKIKNLQIAEILHTLKLCTRFVTPHTSSTGNTDELCHG